MLARGRLYGQIFARGTDKCAAPHSLSSIGKMMGLCSASHSRAKSDLRGSFHSTSLHADSESPPATLISEAYFSIYPGRSYFRRSSSKHPREDYRRSSAWPPMVLLPCRQVQLMRAFIVKVGYRSSYIVRNGIKVCSTLTTKTQNLIRFLKKAFPIVSATRKC